MVSEDKMDTDVIGKPLLPRSGRKGDSAVWRHWIVIRDQWKDREGKVRLARVKCRYCSNVQSRNKPKCIQHLKVCKGRIKYLTLNFLNSPPPALSEEDIIDPETDPEVIKFSEDIMSATAGCSTAAVSNDDDYALGRVKTEDEGSVCSINSSETVIERFEVSTNEKETDNSRLRQQRMDRLRLQQQEAFLKRLRDKIKDKNKEINRLEETIIQLSETVKILSSNNLSLATSLKSLTELLSQQQFCSRK